MKICLLSARNILEIEGADAEEFLQNLITVDISKLAEDAPLWTGMLTPQGKYQFDFFLHKTESGAILLDVHSCQLEELMSELKKYRLRADVKVTDRKDLAVAAIFNQNGAASIELPAPMALSSFSILPDPRLPALGERIIGTKENVENYIGNHEEHIGVETDYIYHRVSLGVPELATDLPDKDIFWLETDAERLGGVDFEKGCFVGQEVTARMKHKTELKKKIIPVNLVGNPVTPCGLASDMIQIGTLLVAVKGRGLAFVRLDKWQNAVNTLRSVAAGDCLVLKAA